MFKAKFNLKFYILCFLLLCIIFLGWYIIYFINVNELLVNNNPMTEKDKILFTIIISLVVTSWTISFLFLIKPLIKNQAFIMDEKGIHQTITFKIFFSLFFVIPVKTIPYKAIKSIEEYDNTLVLNIDKKKIDMCYFFRIFASKRYSLFYGFTKQKQSVIKKELDKFMDKYHNKLD